MITTLEQLDKTLDAMEREGWIQVTDLAPLVHRGYPINANHRDEWRLWAQRAGKRTCLELAEWLIPAIIRKAENPWKRLGDVAPDPNMRCLVRRMGRLPRFCAEWIYDSVRNRMMWDAAPKWDGYQGPYEPNSDDLWAPFGDDKRKTEKPPSAAGPWKKWPENRPATTAPVLVRTEALSGGCVAYEVAYYDGRWRGMQPGTVTHFAELNAVQR